MLIRRILYFSIKCRPYLHSHKARHTTSTTNHLQSTPIKGWPLSLPLFEAWLLIAYFKQNKYAYKISVYCFKYLGFNHVFIYLIFSTFVTFTLEYISFLRFSLNSFKAFQQFNVLFIMQITLHGDYVTNLKLNMRIIT